MRPKLHFANKGFFVLKTMIYVSIKDNAYGFLQGISSTVQAVVSAARDICSLATTQPAFVNILHLGNIFALPQQAAVLFTSNRGASCAGSQPHALLCYRHLLTNCWMQKRNVLFALQCSSVWGTAFWFLLVTSCLEHNLCRCLPARGMVAGWMKCWILRLLC